jgi:lipopolysaccharide/colanic/teichoic acid biosynthesis glycosyltransferase
MSPSRAKSPEFRNDAPAATQETPLRASLITTREEFASVRAEWNALASESEGETVFQRHEWLSAWWSVQDAGAALFIIMLRRAQKIVTAAPLCFVAPGGGRLLRRLQFMGVPIADYADFLVTGDRLRSIAAILDEIFLRRNLWDVLDLAHFRTDSPNFPVVRDELRRRGAAFAEAPRVASPYLPLRQDSETLFAKLPKAVRYDLRKGVQKLAERGLVNYEVLRDQGVAMEALPGFLEMAYRRESTAGRSPRSTSSKIRLLHFFSELISGPAWPLVHFSRMCAGGQAVAYHFGFRHGPRLYWCKPAFDPDYAGCSPGKLLIQFAIRSAVPEGVSELDFLLGSEPYKSQWTGLAREVTGLTVFGSSWRARAARLWYSRFGPAVTECRRVAGLLRRLLRGRKRPRAQQPAPGAISKRAVDLAVSAAALILLSPVLLLVAAAVWIDSGSPVLFAQQRVGRGFRRFTLWKFRSMRPGGGPLVTASRDQRITRLGRFLRAAKLDELPQFWNVLRGDMSLVGPRPEVPEYVALFREQYERILCVRPGITDPATLAFRHEEAMLERAPDPEAAYLRDVLPAKLRISEQYLSHMSMGTDFAIILRTFLAIIGMPASRVCE